jgi:protease-4
MRRLPCIILAVLAMLGTTHSEAFFIPAYYAQSDFLATSPGVSGNSSGGLFNPAIWGLMKGPEMQFFWSDQKKEGPNISNWALLFGSEGLGFTVQHWDFGEPTGAFATNYDRFKLDDYNIGIGFGDAANAFGIGYGWSKGYNAGMLPRDNQLSAGYITRPFRQLSVGAAVHYATREHDARTVADVGFRPLATPLVTLFADAAYNSNVALKFTEWSAGAAMEPVSGIRIYGKMFHGGAYNVGLSLAVAQTGASVSSHNDKDGNQLYNTYGVRVGYPTPSFVTPLMMKKKAYLKLDMDNQIKYQRYKLFDEGGYTLTELLKTLDRARKDPRIAGLTIRITEEMYGSWEVLWEVREKIRDFQSSGKKVIVFLERGGMTQYYLASAADKLVVDPEASVTLMGFNMGRTYYANMLDKLGLGFDEWRFFTYKSAAESFSRTNMSDADREQRQALIDGFYAVLRDDVCRSRNLTPEQFDHIINEVGFLDADSLVAYKLADTTGRWPDMKDWIKAAEGKGKMTIGPKGYAAMWEQDDEWGATPQIAVIYAIGPCSMNDGINARRLEKTIESARNDTRVKAVVLRSDSPGGDVLPSDIVAQELKKTMEKKPVIVSQGMVAASGGYWISMNSNKIVAAPWTITGSIGVIGGWLYDKGFADKLGMTYDNVQMGKHADLGGGPTLPFIGATIPRRNLTPEERSYMEISIKKMYQNFVGKVAKGRNLTSEKVDEIGQGRVWTGTKGKELGLVDEIGGLEKAVSLAREAAKIPEERKVELKEMPDKGLFDPNMFAPKLLGIKMPQWRESERLEMEYWKLFLASEGRPMAMLPPDMMLMNDD